MAANQLMYYTKAPIELDDIRVIAEKNGYRCTSFKLITEDGREFMRFNVHFKYEDNDRRTQEYYWTWYGGTKYGFASMDGQLAIIETWRRKRYEIEQPASGFSIDYALFTLPYLVQFLVLVLRRHSGWVEDSFSEDVYTLSTIDLLPSATAEYLRQFDDDPSYTDD